MKRIKVLISILLVMLLLISCGNRDDQNDTSVETNKKTVATEATTKEITTEETATKGTVKSDIDILREFGMTSAIGSDFKLDYENHYIMALEDVEVRGFPTETVEPIYDLNYELVEVYTAVYRGDAIWVLIRYGLFEGGPDLGWVKESDLTEYTEDVKEKLLFPVDVSDDCKDIDTGEKVEKDDWKIEAIEGDYVKIFRVGGRTNRVRREDIVYPNTIKVTIYEPYGMIDALNSDFELDYQKHPIMTLKDVEVRDIPTYLAEPYCTLNYEIVQVLAAIYDSRSREWVLVRYEPFDDGANMGWVKISDLIEYTDDTKDNLLFPVNVSDDCKDIDTGEKVEKGDWKITSIEGDYVEITRAGGKSNKVKTEDIIYPDTDKLE